MTEQLKDKKTVLISGGSIAGPATAYWLNRFGFQTTIVERWPELRPGGQSVDVSHYGLEAIRRMGLESAIRSRFTGEQGTTVTDKDGKMYMQLPVGNGPTNEFEILRGDFAEMLYEETKDETEWVFGDHIVSVEEQIEGGKVKIGFQTGKEAVYDFVILADGSRSRTRKVVFGESGFDYRSIGYYTAYFSIPLEETTPYSDQWHIVPLTRKRMMYFRPDFKAQASRAGVTFVAPESKGYEKLPPDEQKAIIADLFADGGPNAERLIRGLQDSQDLYFEYLGQVHAPKWSTETGRVILVGDAAWCGTPFIGLGASLSVAGAYILAGEMAKNKSDPEAAMKGYETNMRPIVEEAQPISPIIPWLIFWETDRGVKLFCYVAKIFGAILSTGVLSKFLNAIFAVWSWYSPSVESQVLPDYEKYVVIPKRKGTGGV
ncbi:Monooxygenase, FAD-binding [Phaffia rhodozyma]|uniref:Monooxygenase, FAD-binding n=1 Tax=Phaffia rhodozyma TaxID=264483 RepID=A0A0F7SJ75_PHARH|nr:Monooxygenase, FAD-binding [Phaffia rhodozyma]